MIRKWKKKHIFRDPYLSIDQHYCYVRKNVLITPRAQIMNKSNSETVALQRRLLLVLEKSRSCYSAKTLN